MRCPLLSKEVRVSEGVATLGLVDCLEEACAWWSEGDSICSILQAMIALNYIAGSLVSIDIKLNK